MSAVEAPPSRRHAAVPGTREFVALVATCVAMAALSIDVLLPAFPDLREEFGLAADSTAPARLLTAFFLGLAVGQLVYGPLSDRFGRKPLLYAGLAVYVGAALLATTASSLEALVACRFVWGMGAAGPRSLALAMVRDSYEGERMVRAMSHVMATFILVPVLAPSLGAAALAFAPWRIVFWIPIAAAGLLALWALRLPETLPVERRRSVSPAALLDAFRAVVTTREALAFAVALVALFGIMSAFIGGAEILIEDVFDERRLFPVVFGAMAATLGVGNVLSARFVVRVGLQRWVRGVVCYLLAAAAGLAALALATDGRPPLWAFVIGIGLLLPGVAALIPACNTAAMVPLGHVAGMAAAVLGTVSTGGGALLGALVDGAFDGSIRPFALAALAYATVAALAILPVARRPARAPVEAAAWAPDEPAATA